MNSIMRQIIRHITDTRLNALEHTHTLPGCIVRGMYEQVILTWLNFGGTHVLRDGSQFFVLLILYDCCDADRRVVIIDAKKKWSHLVDVRISHFGNLTALRSPRPFSMHSELSPSLYLFGFFLHGPCPLNEAIKCLSRVWSEWRACAPMRSSLQLLAAVSKGQPSKLRKPTVSLEQVRINCPFEHIDFHVAVV